MSLPTSGNITLKQIRVFLAAAEYENFSMAAEQLYITQPLVSHTIAQLEQELGYPLFTRDKKRVRLNQAGRILQEKLKNIDMLIRKALESSRQAWEDLQAHLMISLPVSTDIQKFFFPIFPLFNAEYPHIRLKTDQMEIGNAISCVVAGTIDLAFTVFPEVSRFQNLPIDWEILAPCATYAEVPASSPLYERESLCLSDLVHEPLALISSDGVSGYTEALLGLFNKHHLSPTATYYVSSSAALGMTSALGEGIVISTAISDKPESSSTRRIPIPEVPNGVIAYWRKENLSPIMRHFIALTKKHLRQCFGQDGP